MKRLDGQAAIVTGSSRGIGRAIAAAFVEEGANVDICSRSESEGAATAGEPGCLFVETERFYSLVWRTRR